MRNLILPALFALTLTITTQAQDEKAVRAATDEFMNAMKNWEDLEPYISTANETVF